MNVGLQIFQVMLYSICQLKIILSNNSDTNAIKIYIRHFHFFVCKCYLLGLFQRMLNNQQPWMSQSCKLYWSFLHCLHYKVPVSFINFIQQPFLKNNQRNLLMIKSNKQKRTTFYISFLKKFQDFITFSSSDQ